MFLRDIKPGGNQRQGDGIWTTSIWNLEKCLPTSRSRISQEAFSTTRFNGPSQEPFRNSRTWAGVMTVADLILRPVHINWPHNDYCGKEGADHSVLDGALLGHGGDDLWLAFWSNLPQQEWSKNLSSPELGPDILWEISITLPPRCPSSTFSSRMAGWRSRTWGFKGAHGNQCQLAEVQRQLTLSLFRQR